MTVAEQMKKLFLELAYFRCSASDAEQYSVQEFHQHLLDRGISVTATEVCAALCALADEDFLSRLPFPGVTRFRITVQGRAHLFQPQCVERS